MRRLLTRRSVSLAEMLVVIAIMLIAAYFTIPSLIGDSERNDNHEATAHLTAAHNAARNAWAPHRSYDTDASVQEMQRLAPDLDFTTTAQLNGTDPRVIYAHVDGDQQITLCNRSASRIYFCLRDNGDGNLHGAGDRARSWGTGLADALCHLPDAGGAPLDCEPARGGNSWNPNVATASATSSDVTAAPAFADVRVAPSADTNQVAVTWRPTGGPATIARCGIDAAPLGPCDELDGHTFTGLTHGEHTLNLRLEGPGGHATHTATWVRTRATSSVYRDVVLADNPIAYWRFDETTGHLARAEVGGLDLMYSGVTQGVPGLIYADDSRAFSADGEGRAYARAIPRGLGATGITVETWVNVPSLPARGAVIKVGHSSEDEGSGNGNGYAIGFGASFGAANNQITVLYENRRWINTGVALPRPGIHHLVLRILPDGAAQVFLNGTLVHTSAGTASDAPTGAVHVGGYWSNTSSRHFAGTIDEVAIYNHVVPEARLRAHYNAGRTPEVG